MFNNKGETEHLKYFILKIAQCKETFTPSNGASIFIELLLSGNSFVSALGN
jgi:hypothetical protein